MTFFVKKCTTFAMKISAIQEKFDIYLSFSRGAA